MLVVSTVPLLTRYNIQTAYASGVYCPITNTLQHSDCLC